MQMYDKVKQFLPLSNISLHLHLKQQLPDTKRFLYVVSPNKSFKEAVMTLFKK